MSEQEKPLGQTGYEAELKLVRERRSNLILDVSWENAGVDTQELSEAAAQAVAARVREECAEILTAAIHPDNNDSWNAALMFGAKSIRAMNEASHG